jgi:hypothetical protein
LAQEILPDRCAADLARRYPALLHGHAPLFCRKGAATVPRSCHSGRHACAPNAALMQHAATCCDRQRHTMMRVRWMLAKGYPYSSFDVADARRQRRHERSRQRMLAAKADPDCILLQFAM